MRIQDVSKETEILKDAMIQTMSELIRIPAIGPENGGEGESKKAEKLMQILQTIGFDKIERHDVDDPRVPSGKRPNIIAYCHGKKEDEVLWIITHLDIVPGGEESLWTVTKPFQPLTEDGKIYGRGSEDNMQPMVASIYAIKALKNLKIKPKRSVALAFVADEEHGSKYGIEHIIDQKLFKKDDLIIVPNSGNESGSFIETAEKSALWFKVHTVGKQTHASKPHMGLNAHRIGMQYATALDRLLHEKYSAENMYFDPPKSTIEPTKKDKNVDAVNIIPGEDITYFDCRMLPNYDLDEMQKDIQTLAEEFEKKTGAKIGIEVVSKSQAPEPTAANARIVLMLIDAIKQTRQIEPKTGGIGGGTCATFFRRINMPAIVWSTIDEMAHQPNEYAKIDNIINDAKIYAYLATM